MDGMNMTMKTTRLVAALAAFFLLGASGAVLAQGALINTYAPPATTTPGDARPDVYGAYGAVRSATTAGNRAARSDQRMIPSEPSLSAPTVHAPFQGR
jgi:hypothetical protein